MQTVPHIEIALGENGQPAQSAIGESAGPPYGDASLDVDVK
jgi:hypothetical protein